jgi:hypothetical protein
MINDLLYNVDDWGLDVQYLEQRNWVQVRREELELGLDS